MESIEYVTDQIIEARVRETLRRAEIAEANKAGRENIKRIAFAHLAMWLPAWAMEYVEYSAERESAGLPPFTLNLPGCAPIEARAEGEYARFWIDEPLSVQYDPRGSWKIAVKTTYTPEIDEAIDLAASWGESWHEMLMEAARRNEAGLLPPRDPPTAAEAALQEARLAIMQDRCPPASAVALLAIAEQLERLNDKLTKMGR